MWKKVYTHPIFALVGAAGTIYGLPGMIEDWGVWQEWQTGAPWWSGFISGFGAAMVTFWAIHICDPTAGSIYNWIVAFKRDPLRLFLVRNAYRAAGNGTRIAKLIEKTRSVETARKIFKIFHGSSGQRGVAHAYASYAQALVRFNFRQEATAVLVALDKKDIPDIEIEITDIEIEEAKDRFFYPHDDGEPAEDLADRIRKEK